MDERAVADIVRNLLGAAMKEGLGIEGGNESIFASSDFMVVRMDRHLSILFG